MIMEQLESPGPRFNDVVINALDEVYGALESDRFLAGEASATREALETYISQVRRIRAAASNAEMHGLHFACVQIERNVSQWQQGQLALNSEQFALLNEVPELLAQYALNQSCCKIDSLIKHLQSPHWPVPLANAQVEQLRQLLNTDPSAQDDCSDCTELPATEPAADPRAALHDALDSLIVTISDEMAFGGGDVKDAQALARYAAKLQSLSSCASQAGVAALAKACDVFAQVVIQRAAYGSGVTAAERDLLNLFPILTMDSIADPDNSAAGSALLALANDPLWDSIHAAASSLSEAAPLAVLPVIVTPEPQMQQISTQMLALLAREIGMMGKDLAQDLQATLAESTPGEALQNYLEALIRIGETAQSLGLSALHAVFVQLTHCIQAQGISLEQGDFLQDLPQHLQTYLSNPIDPEHCLPLIGMLHAWGELDLDGWLAALAFVDITQDEEVQVERHLQASAEDVSLTLPADLKAELLEGLLQELPIQVASFTGAIARFASGHGNMADLEQAKRAAHTLKGAANTVGVAGIANLTHHLEDILLNLSEQGQLPGNALAMLLTEAGDCLEAMSEAVMGIGQAPDSAQAVLQMVLDFANRDEDDDAEALARRLLGNGNAGVNPGSLQLATDTPMQASVSAMPQAVAENRAEAHTEEGAQAAAETMMRVPAPVVDELLRLAGENIISNSQLQERLRLAQKHTKAIQKQDALFQKLLSELENLVDVRGMGAPGKQQHGKHEGEFDPLEFERYNELHTLTSQLIEAATDARQMSGQVDEQLHALGELLQVQRRLQLENQHAVVRTRLVPVSSVVSRLQRCVRQACRLLNKQVQLVVLGEATNIDSNMLHELVDPLMHILRNAVDHGIESPEIRVANGKAASGQIQLRFATEGNAIVVQCQDDGAGLDYAAIHRTALRKNMLLPDRTTSDDELARMILMPGFSTKDSTTQLSGRGIGMDAVHSKILEMKGALQIRSITGQGMLLELRLPTTLLSEHTLMARINGKLLAISSRRIIDLHYITPEQIDTIGNEKMYRVGDALHKVYRLDQLLGMPQIETGNRPGYPALLTNTDNGETCVILVQELIDGRESVVKKLGRYVPKIAGTIGAVILGDGSVAPVLDLQELLRAAKPNHLLTLASASLHQHHEHGMAAALAGKRTALVIDDSLSARRATAQTMRDAGFEVRTAIDGMDAVAMLDQAIPDVILVDMEMPRMNGLEFTTHVRARADARHVPIIMITSRSTEKHRHLGQAAGVNAYLLKPFGEDHLLEQVEQLLRVQEAA